MPRASRISALIAANPRKIVWFFAAVALLAAACAAGPLPILEPPQVVSGSVLVMSPEVRMGAGGASTADLLREPLATHLRQAIAGRGLSVARAPEDELEAFRKAVEAAWSKQRSAGSRRFKPGEDLGLRDLLAAPVASGARLVAFGVLARTGVAGSGEWAAIPPDELILLPEERPDYTVPKTGRQGIARGVDLDLLLIDLQTSQVVLHRRVSHPASDPGQIVDVLSVLAREVTRGLKAP